MSIKSKIKKACRFSPVKTMIINVKYFGIGGVIHPRFIVAKNVHFKALNGSVIIQEGNKIWLGFGEVGFVDHNCERFIWDVSGTLDFRGNAAFGPGCRLICMDTGMIEFGLDFSCNARTKIVCKKAMKIGDNCMISWDCTLMDTDFHKIYGSNGEQRNIDKQIVIGNHCWICSEAMILKGAVIPNGCVVSARSLVSTELSEPKAIYKNNELLRSDISWEK